MTTPQDTMTQARILCIMAENMNPHASKKDINLIRFYLRGVAKAGVMEKQGFLDMDVWEVERECGTYACLGGWAETEIELVMGDWYSATAAFGIDRDKMNLWFGYENEGGDLRTRVARIRDEITRRRLHLTPEMHDFIDEAIAYSAS